MADAFAECLSFTLAQEGGFSDDPRDPGGATNYGITLATLRDWSGDPGLGPAAVQNIGMPTVDSIYRADYWNRVLGDSLPPGVDLSVFDHGVNAGPAASVRLLQQALGFTGTAVDGAVGPITLRAAAMACAAALITQLAALQSAFYHGLRGFDVFGTGWLDRVERRRQAALAMAAAAPAA